MPQARLANLLIDTADRLAAARTSEESWQAVNAVAARIGANAVNASGWLPGSAEPAWAWTSMNPAWIAEYLEANLFTVDPLVRGLAAGRVPQILGAGAHLRPGEASLRDAQLAAGTTRYRYNFFCAQSWTDGAISKLLVLSTEHDPTDLFGPGTGRALRAVSAMLATGLAPPQDFSRGLAFGLCYQPLSPRERDVLSLLAHGLGNDAIAHRLGLAEVTVRLHLRAARRKMGAATREQALALAMARGMIDL